MANKLEELEKKAKEANKAYRTACKDFYFEPDYKDCDCYFSIDKKRKKLENNYINARDNLEAANTAYDIEITKQKQGRRLLYLKCEIEKFNEYKTSLSLEGLKKLEELENEMKEIYEVYFSTSEYKTVEGWGRYDISIDITPLEKKLAKEVIYLRDLKEIADSRYREAWEAWMRTEDEYDKNIMDFAEMEYRNAWEAWSSACDALDPITAACYKELEKQNDKNKLLTQIK